MRLKCHTRIKDGKEHRYWSIVESLRCGRARVVQRHILYLGELNDAPGFGVQIRLEAMRLERPRQWGACWLFTELWAQLQLDEFWRSLLPDSREDTS